MIVAEYGGEIQIGYLYAAAGAGFLAYAVWAFVLTVREEIQYHRDERTLRELDALESDDLAAGGPPAT